MNNDNLRQRSELKRAEVVALTQDPVRVPTINPPGDAHSTKQATPKLRWLEWQLPALCLHRTTPTQST